MNRWLPAAAAILGAAALQVAVAPHMSIGGIVPNLLLLVVVTLAFVGGSSAGLYGGFAAGLVLDMIGTGPVGAWALVLALTGYLSGMLAANVFAEGWLLPVTVAGLACLLAESVYVLYLLVVGRSTGFFSSLVGQALPGALYDTVLALLAYPWLARFLRRDTRVTELGRIG